MMDPFHIPILNKHGFQKIAEINYDLAEELFWNPEKLVQVSVMLKPPLVKCTKFYSVVGQTEVGETFARDLSGFSDWLETHYSEFRLSFFFFRDVDDSLILKRITQKKLRETGMISDMDPAKKEKKLELISEKLKSIQNEIKELDLLSGYSNSEFKMLNNTMNEIAADLKSEKNRLQLEGQKLSNEIQNTKYLLRAYRKRSVSAGILFSNSSNLQTFNSENEFEDALYYVVKEVTDAHKFQVKQKLEGGKLNIFIQEVESPSIAFQIEWIEILNPNQLSKMGQSFNDLKQKTDNFLSVFPKEDIKVDGHVKDEKKLFPARFIWNIFKRGNKSYSTQAIPTLPKEGKFLGNVMIGETITHTPVKLPLKPSHLYFSGKTKHGKTHTGRCVIENALDEGINVTILDNTRQWSGIGIKNDNEIALKRFDKIGLDRQHARGFDCRIYTPYRDVGLDLPDNLYKLFNGCSVISLKGLTDNERCKVAKKILQAAYNSLNKESEKIELMIVIEESHINLPENVDKGAKEIAKEVRNLIRRIAREKLKYGLILLFITQSLSDFKNDAKIVRELVRDRFFHNSTDPAEEEYIKTYLDKESFETIKNLKPGEAVVHNSDIPGIKVFIRPPYSAVREPTDDEIKQINRGIRVTPKPKFMHHLNPKQSDALRVIQHYYSKHKAPMPSKMLDSALNISTSTRSRRVNQLIKRGVIKTIDIPATEGRPAQGLIPLVE